MSSIWQNLLGTVESKFQFKSGKLTDTSANILKSVANALEARNATDAAYIVGRGADPVIANDWVTLQYGNANYLSAAAVAPLVSEIRFAITNVGGNSVTAIPINAIVIDCEIKVTTPFTAASTIAVARGADTLQLATENNPEVNGLYCNHQDTPIAAAGVVAVTIVGAAVGAGFCIVRYVATPNP